MPIVHVNIWKGISEEDIKSIMKGITEVFVDLGIPAKAVEIVVHEIPKTHWGRGGFPASDADFPSIIS